MKTKHWTEASNYREQERGPTQYTRRVSIVQLQGKEIH